MSKTPHVVDGEASESDSDEIDVGQIGKQDATTPQHDMKGSVISGEAPESDDETVLPSINKLSIEDPPLQTPLTFEASSVKIYNSLLHQKLWECNVSLRATLDGLLKHTTEIAVEKLSTTDKTLLSVQESMRATNANLTLARARLKQIHQELDKANCKNALPTVKT